MNKGQHLSPESRAKTSIARKGKHNSPGTEFKKGHPGRFGADNPASWPENRAAICAGQRRRYAGHKVERICKYKPCSKIFNAFLSDVKRGRGEFCGPDCFHAWWTEEMQKPEYIVRCCRLTEASPNKEEQRLLALLEKHNLPFAFVGNGQVFFDSLNPDFINTNGKKQIIELFGDFHHNAKSPPRRWESVRRKVFAKYGYSLLVIWVSELHKLPEEEIVTRVRRFYDEE